MKPAFSYYGGKQKMASKIMSLLPPQETYRGYCEPFCGGATLFWKRPFDKKCVDTLNDTNGSVINFFRVLRDSEQAMHLFRMLYFTPYSREIHKEARDLNAGRISEPIKGDVDKAWAFWNAIMQGYQKRENDVFAYCLNGNSKNDTATTDNRKQEISPDIDKAWAFMQAVVQGFNCSTDTDWSSIKVPTGGAKTSTKQMQHQNRGERMLPDVDKAWAFMAQRLMGFGAMDWTFGYSKTTAGNQEPLKAENIKERVLPEGAQDFLYYFFQPIHQLVEISKYTERLKMVQLENIDALKCIEKYDTEHTLFYCFPPDRQVQMLDLTTKDISKLKNGDVLSNGNKVLNIMSRHHQGYVVKLQYQSGIEPIICTEDHKLATVALVRSGKQDRRSTEQLLEQVEFKPAKDIMEGDYLLRPKGALKEQDLSWLPELDCTAKKNGRRQDITFMPSDLLGLLLGAYAGDGHIQRDNKRIPRSVIISLNYTTKLKLADKLLYAIKSCFGFDAYIREHSPHETSRQIYINNTSIAEWFSKVIPGDCYTKKFDDRFLTSDRGMQIQILRGWLMTDGSVDRSSRNRTKLVGTSVSKELIKQMQIFGHRCGVYLNYKKRLDNHDLYCSKKGYDIIYPEFNLGGKARSVIKDIGDYYLVPVRHKSTEYYDDIVYDIDVDGDDTFICDGILAHNCDPPYPNTDQGHYKGYTQEDFEELVFLLTTIKGSFLLSNYPNDYADAYAKQLGWERFEFSAMCSAAKNSRTKRTEVVWRKLNDNMKEHKE